jgi:hypothetical protein
MGEETTEVTTETYKKALEEAAAELYATDSVVAVQVIRKHLKANGIEIYL